MQESKFNLKGTNDENRQKKRSGRKYYSLPDRFFISGR